MAVRELFKWVKETPLNKSLFSEPMWNRMLPHAGQNYSPFSIQHNRNHTKSSHVDRIVVTYEDMFVVTYKTYYLKNMRLH